MKKYLRIFTMLAATCMLAGIFVYVFVINKSHPDYAAARADYALNAGEIFEAYRSDKAAASSLYDGKIVELTGQLTAIESADNEAYLCFVLDEGLFGPEGVRLHLLKSENNKVSTLQQGEWVRIKGYVTGYNETDVLLEHGSLVQ
ncbi:MAG TPA: hypothetical protein PK939_02255 [Bacteroidales bacterium]|nr:hypothetical protein [Bacteroidales bacterium]